MRPGKRLKSGDRVGFGRSDDAAGAGEALWATVIEKGSDGEVALEFESAGADLDQALAAV